LRDAGHFIAKLPNRKHSSPEWQAAIQALMLVAEKGGPTMLPEIGIMQALHRNVERVFTYRKDPHWGKRKLARGR
jgi:hypothetical protein